MIIQLPEEICANHSCKQKLDNGANCGGWVAQKQKTGGYLTGYTCKRCSNQSMPGTSQLRLYQQTQQYTIPTNNSFPHTTNKTIEHKRQWTKLMANIAKDDEQTNAPNNSKMPEWNQVIQRMEQNKKEGKEE